MTKLTDQLACGVTWREERWPGNDGSDRVAKIGEASDLMKEAAALILTMQAEAESRDRQIDQYNKQAAEREKEIERLTRERDEAVDDAATIYTKGVEYGENSARNKALDEAATEAGLHSASGGEGDPYAESRVGGYNDAVSQVTAAILALKDKTDA